MNAITTKLILAAVVVIGLSGATVAVVHHNSQVSSHNAMMAAEAMKKADEAKAMKSAEAEAAMKKEDDAKAAAGNAPAATDAMVHATTTPTTPGQ